MNSYSDPFRLLIKDLADHLTNSDVANIKYLWKDSLPKGLAEKCNTSMALLEKLEDAMLITRDNIDLLDKAFNIIPRKDLLHKLKAYRSNGIGWVDVSTRVEPIASESTISFPTENSDEEIWEKIPQENSSSEDDDDGLLAPQSTPYQTPIVPGKVNPFDFKSLEDTEKLVVELSPKLVVDLPPTPNPPQSLLQQSLLPPSYFEKTSPNHKSEKTNSKQKSKPVEDSGNRQGEGIRQQAHEIGRQPSSSQVRPEEYSSQFRPEEYSMEKNPHGDCIIFSNRFDIPIKLNNGTGNWLHPRQGTEIDVSSLKKTFEYLRYKVTVHRNLAANYIIEKLQGYARQKEQENNDSFVCCILSHGYDGGIYGNDGVKIGCKQLRVIFEGNNCTGLISKPKLFFIQACQGDNDGQGVTLQADAPCFAQDHLGETGSNNKPPAVVFQEIISTDADFLSFYATTSGNISRRDPENGSWFIQTLCTVFQRFAEQWSLSDMLIKVNDEIALKKQSLENGLAKQMSTIGDNTIRKKLYFHPKSYEDYVVL